MSHVSYLIVLFLGVSVFVVLAEKVEFYSDKYDHIDVEGILGNDKLRNSYLKCVLATGPCTNPAAKFLRDKFPEAIVTRCKKCTERQKYFFDKVTEYYVEKEPETWNMILTRAIDNARNNKN